MIRFPQSAALAGAPAAADRRGARASGRNVALDFTKGALVLCMIAYHTINYFRYDPDLLRHLHFLPPSFIFIAGFLVTHLYLPKIQTGDAGVPRRLFVRGLKTLALFLGLNLLVHALVPSSYNRSFGLDAFLGRLDVILLTGEERASVFGVLLPISYVLLLSAVLVLATRRFAPAFHVVALAAGLACLLLAHVGRLPFNLELVSMGLLGALAGFTPRDRLDRLARFLAPIVLAYAAYSIAVLFRYPTYAMNLLGITLSLLLFYAIGQRLRKAGALRDHVLLLGHYSLFAYLVQIAFLQALFRVARQFDAWQGAVALPLVLTTIATLLAVKVLHALRSRVGPIDAVYQGVFA